MKDIVLSNVSKKFQRQILRDLTVTFPAGSITCVRGVSGGGKTTLFRLLCGLEAPDSGTITGTEGVRFGWVFQENRLLPQLNALANVSLASGAPDRTWWESALRALHLDAEEMEKPVSLLSGGMQRRVALLRAVHFDCEVLLLDEPFTGLDEATRADAIAWLLAERRGRTMLVISHSPEEIAAIGGTVLSLDRIEE